MLLWLTARSCLSGDWMLLESWACLLSATLLLESSSSSDSVLHHLSFLNIFFYQPSCLWTHDFTSVSFSVVVRYASRIFVIITSFLALRMLSFISSQGGMSYSLHFGPRICVLFMYSCLHLQLHRAMFIDSCGWSCSLTAVAGHVDWQLQRDMLIDSYRGPCSLTSTHSRVHWQLHTAVFIDSYRGPCLLTSTHSRVHWQLQRAMFIDSCRWSCSLTAVVMFINSCGCSCSLTAVDGHVHWQLWLVLFTDSCQWWCSLTAADGDVH